MKEQTHHAYFKDYTDSFIGERTFLYGGRTGVYQYCYRKDCTELCFESAANKLGSGSPCVLQICFFLYFGFKGQCKLKFLFS